MGRQANSIRDRWCRTCNTLIRRVTADELQDHAKRCRDESQMASRMEAIGLVRPQLSLEGAAIVAKEKRLRPGMGGRR